MIIADAIALSVKKPMSKNTLGALQWARSSAW